MDIDRYIARNEPTWLRLADLTTRARRSMSSLSPPEVEELVQLYQRVSAHLSYVRTYLRDPVLISRLTQLVATANGVLYGKRARTWRAVGRFFALTYPAAVYQCRRQIAIAAAVFFVPALLIGVYLSSNQQALDASGSKKVREHYVHDLFEPYYSDQPAPVFFTQVTTNNIRVSFIAYAFGAVSAGLGAVLLLVMNGAPLGIISAWMISEGDFARFLGFILPHGALELSAIVIAGGAGIALGWTMIVPGDRSRGDAFREVGLRSVTILIGLMTMFLAAGLIEGFITGSGLPTGVRIGIGALLWVAYVGYLVTQGRVANARGITGLLSEPPRDWADEPDRGMKDDLVVPGRLT